MFITVLAWNATRRELLDQLKGVVDAQVRIDGVSEIRNTDIVQDILNQLSDMTAQVYFYLARNFDLKIKRDTCFFHHLWMVENILARQFHRMLVDKVVIWSTEIGENHYCAKIHMERYVAREGELTVELFLDKKMICVGSFSVVPAHLFALDGREVLLISRIQGGKDKIDDIKLATKIMSDVAPRAVFFAVLTGIAKAMNVDHIVGICAENYVDLLPEKREALDRQYDDFFKSLDAAGPQDGFYICDIWAPKKPVTSLKAGHRVRTRRKRMLKEAISDSAMSSFSPFLSQPAARPSQPAARRSLAET